MLREFSFDTKGLGTVLKTGVLMAVIFVSTELGSRQAAELATSAGAANTQNSVSPAARGGSGALVSIATTSAAYFRKTNLPRNVPVVEGAGAIAVDLETGAILFEKNKDDIFPTASVAKLMTAVVAQETVSSSTVITAGSNAISTYGNSGGIVRGESFRVADLLYGLLLPSSNDAARIFEFAENTLADQAASSSPNVFVSAMNERAKLLGMTHTRYADSSGLKKETVSSASDQAKLLRHIYLQHQEIAAASRTRQHVVVSGGRKIRHIWDNINWPAGDKKFLGGKAGFTDEAMETMAGIYLINPSRSGARPIGIVILGSRHRVQNVRAIVRYVESQFTYGTTTTLTGTIERPGLHFSGAAIFEAVGEYLR